MKLLHVCFLLALSLTVQAAPGDPPQSLYHFDARLTNQAGVQHGLDVQRGAPVLVTMFYGNCPMACPLLIDTIRAVERRMPEAQRKAVRVLMISIDPERDTPAALAKLAQERRIDTTRWILASTDPVTVKKIAALLNVQYRRLPDGGYNHSSIVTLLSRQGDIVAQSSMLGRADEVLIAAMGSSMQR